LPCPDVFNCIFTPPDTRDHCAKGTGTDKKKTCAPGTTGCTPAGTIQCPAKLFTPKVVQGVKSCPVGWCDGQNFQNGNATISSC
jgi:hypothetical protein